MITCFDPQFKDFQAGETILAYSDEGEKVGIFLSGEGSLHYISEQGESSLLEVYRKGDLFGDVVDLPAHDLGYLAEKVEVHLPSPLVSHPWSVLPGHALLAVGVAKHQVIHGHLIPLVCLQNTGKVFPCFKIPLLLVIVDTFFKLFSRCLLYTSRCV